jgi:hypothetical protein
MAIEYQTLISEIIGSGSIICYIRSSATYFRAEQIVQ